jgi:general L-amino acid transport system substrate-binding protein
VYLLAVPADRAVAGRTLDSVNAHGKLACAANGNRAGFCSLDSRDQWKGMDVDTCRAVAASGVGDTDKVERCANWFARRYAARPQ